MKKKKNKNIAIFSLIILAIASIMFVACKDEEQEEKSKIETKRIVAESMPDGIYTATYYKSNGEKVEIVDTWRRNKIISRIENGSPGYLAPRGYNIFGKDADIRAAELADKLVKRGWPCVRIIYYGKSFTGEEKYYVECDYLEEDGSCWYDTADGL